MMQGVSFKLDGHVLTWQKWSMHIAFSHREGVAISTVTYNDDGEIRPLFYRLSLCVHWVSLRSLTHLRSAEMIVPYAAPEFPHPRKFAFDV
jgi:primary-amine oxidase